jgi:dipeptidase E
MPRPTIFAMGGGGFLSEPADAALERYVLDLAEPVEPRICFLPTASEHALDRILPEAWERGVALCGLSAGSMCWFRHGITKSGGPPELVAGLGLLPASNSVHWTAEPDRRAAYVDAVARGLEPGWGVDDGAGLRFDGTELAEAVSARPESRAYRVRRRDGAGAVTAIPVRHLSAPDSGVKAPPPEVAELRELRAARRGGRYAS